MVKKAKQKSKISEQISSDFMSVIKRGVEKKVIAFNNDQSKITYYCSREYTVGFKNPEEKIRAVYLIQLVIDYQYEQNLIDLEVRVPRRTPEDRADIVIYEDDELKKPYLVVECKKDGVTDAEFKQAIEQAFGNANSLRAKFAIVVAGNTKTAFDVAAFKPSEREKNVIADIPVKFGKAPKYKFVKGDKDRELRIASREELIRTLQKCHDTVWQGGKLNPTTAFDEISKLMFCKLKDEKDGTRRGEYYRFQVGTHETASEVAKRINSIYEVAQEADPEVFREIIQLDDGIVYSVVEHLQGLAISKIDLDSKGVAFERFMQDFFKGKMGQFFTPRQIVEFCVQMLEPKNHHLVLDPACGSGGFLLYTLDAVREFADNNYDEQEAWDYWHKFAANNLFGIEINDQIARVCKMNMIIHDDGHTNIINSDALERVDIISAINKGFKRDFFDLVLTNPPFGAIIRGSEKDYLDKYKLSDGKKSQKSEILFIERCLDFVKPKTGRVGIIIPDSIVINSSLKNVRSFILDDAKILAIISLPDFAFSHYGANVKSSILFLQKSEVDRMHDYPVFMASAEKIGYTTTGKEDVENDLPVIANHFRNFMANPSKFRVHKKIDNKIFVVQAQELRNDRMDVKGHSRQFKALRSIILQKKPKLTLEDCLIDTLSGDWGLDSNAEDVDKNDFELCYVLRNTNFDNDFNLDFSNVAIRYIKKNLIKKLKLQKNDILVEKSGGSPYQPVGRVAIITALPFDKPVIFSNFLLKIVIDKKKIDPTYIYTYLQTLYEMGYMEFIQNQTTGIKNLLLDEFLSIPVVVPGQYEQIAKNRLDGIHTVKEKVTQAYRALNQAQQDTRKQIFD